jgi:hypothetical protein
MLEDIAHFADWPSHSNEHKRTVPRSLEWTHYHDWPALSLRQGALELLVVPAVGGRLMGIQHAGEELAFVNPALAGKIASDDPAAWAALCGEWTFPLWGGGKTWVAPESRWPDGAPHRDLDSGAYKVVKTWSDEHSMGIELESPICSQSGLQIHRCISLDATSSTWSTVHRLTNKGSIMRECGIWEVLMLNRPAHIEIALDASVTDLREAVRQIAGKGPIEDICESDIVSFGTRTGEPMLSVECERAIEYKFGVAHSRGEMRVTLPGRAGPHRYRRVSQIDPHATYAHGTPLEVFNAPRLPYFEIETHAPLARLKAGEWASYTIVESVD